MRNREEKGKKRKEHGMKDTERMRGRGREEKKKKRKKETDAWDGTAGE